MATLTEAKTVYNNLLEETKKLLSELEKRGVDECTNESGMRRVRQQTLTLEKLGKSYRKATIHIEK